MDDSRSTEKKMNTMWRKFELIMVVLVAIPALLAVACGGGGTGDAGAAPASTNLAPNVGAAAVAQSSSSTLDQGIMVSGVGTVTAKPDTAVLSLGVSTLASTAIQSRDQAATSMNKLLDSLKANGVDEKDIATTQFSLNPEYNYSGTTPRLTGYRVTNSVSAKVRNVDHAADTLDAAVNAVGDDLQIGGITFTVDDPSALTTQARAAAMGDARSKAQQLADEGGVTLGKPTSITEVSSPLPTPITFDRAAQAPVAGAASTTVEPGQQEITVSVQVAYAVQ
jgi:uncharacterized protein YggE